ncbi:MAG: hypothetical protein AB1632_12305 [Nitrospirota bacterium]
MEDFRVCVNCEYQKGFHVTFKRLKGKVKIALVCPNCGQSFDIGWTTSTIKSFKAEKGVIY